MKFKMKMFLTSSKINFVLLFLINFINFNQKPNEKTDIIDEVIKYFLFFMKYVSITYQLENRRR